MWIKKLLAQLVQIGPPPLGKYPRSCGEGQCPVLKWHMQGMSWFDGFAYLISLWFSMQQTGLGPYSPNMLILAKKQIKKFPSFLISSPFLPICCCLCLLFRRLSFRLGQPSDSVSTEDRKKNASTAKEIVKSCRKVRTSSSRSHFINYFINYLCC